MKKSELLASLDDIHEAYLELLQGVSEEQLVRPNTIGEWSFRDVLVHLSMWEAEAIKMLYQARQGQTPKDAFSTTVDENEQNRLWVEASRDRPFERVMDDFTIIREQTIRRLDTFTDNELNDPARFPWLHGRTLTSMIQEYILDHEMAHAQDLRNWLNRQGTP